MLSRPALTVVSVVAWTAGGLWVDSRAGTDGQLVLGALTAAVLIALLALHGPDERLRTALVVGVATCGEAVGSLLWGLYTYRHGNLPAFVPPGHGLVYLAGLGLARAAGRRSGLLTAAAAVAAAAWGVVSLTALSVTDTAGAVGCGVLLLVLVTRRSPVYAGVFFAVAALELYGTAVGTWTWASTVPGLGLGQANPPSGVASGYVLFDVVALALAPGLAGLLARLRGWASSPALAQPALAGSCSAGDG
jgi:hypothetical protein